MTQKSISQLDTIAQAHDTDLFEVAAVDAQSASGYKSGKMSAEVMAEGLLSTYTYPTAMPNMQNKTITGALNQLLANFAPAYDDTETYAVGDVCTYNGQLYKCTTAVSTAETFDPTKWAAIVVTELSGGHNYSTSEQIVGTWIDGKPLYEKTFSLNYDIAVADWTLFDNSVAYGVLVDYTIIRIKNTESIIVFPDIDSSNAIRFRIDNGEIDYFLGANREYSGYVTFKYTKTTD